MLREQWLEQARADPLEALAVLGCVLPVDHCCACQGIDAQVSVCHRLDHAVEQVLLIAFQAFSVFVDAVSVQQAGIEHAHRKVEPVLDGVEVDAVAQDVAVYRLQEREAR